jgi:hypothetical protein
MYMTVAVGAVVSCISAPTALAEYYGQEKNYTDQNGTRHSEYYSNSSNRSHRHYRSKGWQRAHQQEVADRNDNNNWKWEQHNWNDQRSKLRADWRAQRNRLTAQQQQKIDDDMKAQWNQYHHNKWTGQYSWDQYSDPRFLDYVHTSNPSLMTTVRSLFGY